MPHEFTHSWNGKYRRAADLWTPDYRTPMQDRLMWVYEGQTQFWGYVLAARSGMLSKQETLDAIAATAATYALVSPAGHGARSPTRPTSRSLRGARRSRGAAGSAARIITARAN